MYKMILVLVLVLSFTNLNAQFSRNTVSMKDAIYGKWINADGGVTLIDSYGNLTIGVGVENWRGQYKITKQKGNEFVLKGTGFTGLNGYIELKLILSDDKLTAIPSTKVVEKGKTQNFASSGKLTYGGEGFEDPSNEVDLFIKDLIKVIESKDENKFHTFVEYPVFNDEAGEDWVSENHKELFSTLLYHTYSEPEPQFLGLLKKLSSNYLSNYKHFEVMKVKNDNFSLRLTDNKDELSLTYHLSNKNGGRTHYWIFSKINGKYKLKVCSGYESS